MDIDDRKTDVDENVCVADDGVELEIEVFDKNDAVGRNSRLTTSSAFALPFFFFFFFSALSAVGDAGESYPPKLPDPIRDDPKFDWDADRELEVVAGRGAEAGRSAPARRMADRSSGPRDDRSDGFAVVIAVMPGLAP